MTDRIRLEVSGPERAVIVAALAAYGMLGTAPEFVNRIVDALPYDAANDGPEVEFIAALQKAEVALEHSLPRAGHYPDPVERHRTALVAARRALGK